MLFILKVFYNSSTINQSNLFNFSYEIFYDYSVKLTEYITHYFTCNI